MLLFRGSNIEVPVILCSVYGFRRSEVLGLRWHNVDLERRTITISETLQQHTGGDYIDTPKTESSYRTLPMTDSVHELLSEQYSIQQKRKELIGDCYHDCGFVCVFPDGKVISPNYLSRTFTKSLQRAVCRK
jgi:integrase